MSKYLKNINNPEDIKKLSMVDLKKLAKEIRSFLIHNISKTGGHLSSNLGVVELTLALHYCFNTPEDKIIWDVGHQAYVHKILTGRKSLFNTLRKFNGLSGFPKSNESEHDAFNTGHSSTSISAALGYAKARDILKEDFSVISVIGDGSLTGGLAFEALNNAGRSNTKMIVILNDNQMSISKNVGGMSKYLCEIRTEPMYLDVKEDIEKMLKRIPAIGEGLVKSVKSAKEGIKYFFIPGVLFEELGFTYLGPIDGHDIPALINVLYRAKKMNEPVIIHVRTKKGKGYLPAEQNPCKFHGIHPFNIKTGEVLKKSGETYSDVFGEHLCQMAQENSKIVAITAAMPEGTGLSNFANRYMDRFFDVGIAEQHAVTFSAGLACSGFKPFVAIYSSFLQRAYDQIIHDVCLQNLPVVFAIDRSGLVGADGETHQGIYDLSFLNHIPNMTILAPRNKQDLIKMLDFAETFKAPLSIRYPKGAISELDIPVNDIEYGKCEWLSRGKDVAIIAVGSMNDIAYEAANLLEEYDIEVSLINARFVKPLDKDMLKELNSNYKYVFTIEENVITGGFGSSLLQVCNDCNFKDMDIFNFALPDNFIEHGTRNQLLNKYGLNSEKIVKCILDKVKSK